MIDCVDQIREFYSLNHFPGTYSIGDLDPTLLQSNRYFSLINRFVGHGQRVLDVGCGTGFVTNLLATNYRSEFTGIDFSTAITVGAEFASEHNIQNVKFYQQDLFEHTAPQYDVIVGMSVLTHVPNYVGAIEHLNSMLRPGGVMLQALFNSWGNRAKRILPPNYCNARLELDQQHNPFDVCLSHQQVLDLWPGFELLSVTPSIQGHAVDFCNLFNRTNGGLTLYAFRKTLT